MSSGSYLYVEDFIERIEELLELYPDIEAQIVSQGCAWLRESTEDIEHCEKIASADEVEEYIRLKDILSNLEDEGDDHEWKGSWYPQTLIADKDFTDYAIQCAYDAGLLKEEYRNWPLNHIDWESAALALKQDYSSIDIEGTTYWYR